MRLRGGWVGGGVATRVRNLPMYFGYNASRGLEMPGQGGAFPERLAHAIYTWMSIMLSALIFQT